MIVYPLYGQLELTPATALADALQLTHGRHGVAVDPLLIDAARPQARRYAADRRARIRSARRDRDASPIALSDGFILGPRVLMSAAGLDATGLVSPAASSPGATA